MNSTPVGIVSQLGRCALHRRHPYPAQLHLHPELGMDLPIRDVDFFADLVGLEQQSPRAQEKAQQQAAHPTVTIKKGMYGLELVVERAWPDKRGKLGAFSWRALRSISSPIHTYAHKLCEYRHFLGIVLIAPILMPFGSQTLPEDRRARRPPSFALPQPGSGAHRRLPASGPVHQLRPRLTTMRRCRG